LKGFIEEAIMPKSLPNQREEIILAVLTHGEKYGREIRDLYQERVGRPMPLGSLYTTLDRMVEAGYVTSREGGSNPERGGNRRRFYKIAAPGLAALNSLRASSVGSPALGKAGVAHV
jgi:DNA-binding PadR family transcriptional regulator